MGRPSSSRSPLVELFRASHAGARNGAGARRVAAAGARARLVEVRGAREHNLDIDSPRRSPSGSSSSSPAPSGSGKSSLAFDTLYAEGQRRYVETLSAYARQFLGQLERPKVDHLRGLSPTIAIEQKSASSNPRSTVGTITEIYDYLRVLYATRRRAALPRLRQDGRARRARGQIAQRDPRAARGDARSPLLAPLVAHRKGEFRELFDELKARGFARVVHRRRELARARASRPRSTRRRSTRSSSSSTASSCARATAARIAESVELALARGRARCAPSSRGGGARSPSAQARACCGVAFPELSPQSFSFNTPARHVPGVQRPRHARRGRPGARRPRPRRSRSAAAPSRPGRPRMARGEGWTARIVDGGGASACEVDLDMPWKQAPARRSRSSVLYGIDGRAHRRPLGQGGDRRPRHLGHAATRASSRTSSAATARPTSEATREQYRTLHARAALRRLRRQAPAARDPRRARRAARASPSVTVDDRRATPSAHVARARRCPARAAGDRRGRAARDRQPPRASCSTSASTT